MYGQRRDLLRAAPCVDFSWPELKTLNLLTVLEKIEGNVKAPLFVLRPPQPLPVNFESIKGCFDSIRVGKSTPVTGQSYRIESKEAYRHVDTDIGTNPIELFC